MKKQKIIIDFEFNGLPRYNFEPEITQVKMKNLTNGVAVGQVFHFDLSNLRHKPVTR